MRKTISLALLSLVCLLGFGQSPDPILSSIYDFRLDHAEKQISELEYSVKKADYTSLLNFMSLMSDQTEESYSRFETDQKGLIKEVKGLTKRATFGSNVFFFRHYMYSTIAAGHYGDYPSAAKSIIRSHKYFMKLENEHPAHPETKLAKAFFSIIADQVPNQYRKMLPLRELQQSGKDGFEQLSDLYMRTRQSPSRIATESGLLWILLLWEFSSDSDQTWATWDHVQENPNITSLLSAKYIGIMAAFKAGKRDYLEETFIALDDEALKRLPFLYYQKGKHLIYRMDKNGLSALDTFVSLSPHGNFVKSARLRQGWYYTVKGENEKAAVFYDRVLSEGHDKVWADEQALREVKSVHMQDGDLLRLRMLFDGGYYKECLSWISEIEPELSMKSSSFKAEILYRKGSSLIALRDDTQALKVLETLLESYSQVESYILPKSAIMAAEISESLGQYDRAIELLRIGELTNKYAYSKTFERQIQTIERRITER